MHSRVNESGLYLYQSNWSCENSKFLKKHCLQKLCVLKHHELAIITWTMSLIFFFFFFDFDFTARQDYFTHSEPSQAKMRNPGERSPYHPQADLGLSHMWPERGPNPQGRDDEWFTALKISSLDHSAMGATMSLMRKSVFRDVGPGLLIYRS